jgi:hypothetical protein
MVTAQFWRSWRGSAAEIAVPDRITSRSVAAQWHYSVIDLAVAEII